MITVIFKTRYPGILLDIDIRTGFTDLTQRQADILICAYNDHPNYMIGKKLAPIYVGSQDPSLVSVMTIPRQFHHDPWMLTHPDLKNTQRIKAFMGFMYDQTKGAKGV